METLGIVMVNGTRWLSHPCPRSYRSDINGPLVAVHLILRPVGGKVLPHPWWMKRVSSSRRLTCASSRWRRKIQTDTQSVECFRCYKFPSKRRHAKTWETARLVAPATPCQPWQRHPAVCPSVSPCSQSTRLLQSQLVQPKHRSYCSSTLWSKCASLKTKRFHLKPPSVKKQNKRKTSLYWVNSRQREPGGGNTRTSIQPENTLHYWSTMRPITTFVCLFVVV